MGFLDDLLGNTSADAAKAAAADTYAKQQAATSTLVGQGQDYANKFAGLGQQYSALGNAYNPWISTGQTANSSLQQLLADPSSISSLPGYQFDLSQGTKALDHSALANGSLFSGKQGKALEGYGVNLADKTYGDQLSRLLGISQQGLGAQGQQNAAYGGGIQLQGQGLTGQLGANTSAYNGNMTSAGTIGQGDVAAANAKAKGLTNLLSIGGSVLGSALGGPLGGSIGSGFGSLFGGSPSYGGGTFLDSAYGGSKSSPLQGLTAADYG